MKAQSGWLLLWALAGAQVVAWGAVYYSFSLFVVPMEAELGWSRTAINGALSLGLLTSGLAAYPVGRWIDRHGGRALMTAGSALATVLLAAWSRTESLAGFYAIWIGLGLALAATLYEPVFAVVTRRFPDSYRTRITALTLVGGFASTVFIPLTQLFIYQLGWRDALLALALCNAAICIPVHGILLRDRAVRAPGTAGSGSGRADDDALRRALRHPVFWGLIACFTAYYTAFSAMTFHIVPLLTERSVPIVTIVAALAVIGPAQVAGRIVLFAWRDSLTAATVGRVATTMFPASILMLIVFPASTTVLFLAAAVYGAANGVFTIVRGTAVPELMWKEGYGAINGALTFPANVAKAVAPYGAAVIWNASGNYNAVLWSMFAAGIAAALGFWYASLKGHRKGRKE
jgi:predicted MFS family arabinose efflux permease